MKEFLLDCKERREIVEFKTYFDPDVTESGFVEEVSSSLVCFSIFEDDGEFLDFSIIGIEELYFIRKGSSELTKILKNIEKNKNIPPLKKLSLSNFKNSLISVNQNYGYVVVHVEEVDPEVCYIGEVLKVGELLTLQAFGSKANPGRSIEIIKVEDVSRISFEGKYEKGLARDYKNNIILLRQINT